MSSGDLFSDKMKVAVVGAGPVGLVSAVLLKKCVLYEKRPKYTREQFIVTGGTKSDVFQMLPGPLRKELSKKRMCFIDNPADDRVGACFIKNPGESSEWKQDDSNTYFATMKINDFEKVLINWIKKNLPDVKIIKKEFTVADAANYDVIVGTDGTKSVVREKLMKDKWHPMEDYSSYILHMIYTDKSNAQFKIDTPDVLRDHFHLTRSLAEDALKYSQDRFRVIRSNGNKTQFMLQIPKTDYNKIKHMTKFSQLPAKLKAAVIFDVAFMQSKPTNLENTKITVYEQKIGHADKFAKMVDKTLCILLGDSAMVNHIFTGEGFGVDWWDMTNLIERYSAYLYGFPTVFQGNRPYVINPPKQIIANYNRVMLNHYMHYTRARARLKAIPYKLLKTICAKIKRIDLSGFLQTADIEINKDEMCLILRDYVLRNYAYMV